MAEEESVTADPEIYLGLVRLRELIAAGDAIQPSIFQKFYPGLMETKRNVFGNALVKAVNPLGEKIELKILPLAYHLPAFFPPGIL